MESEREHCHKCGRETWWHPSGKALKCAECGTRFPCADCDHEDCKLERGDAPEEDEPMARKKETKPGEKRCGKCKKTKSIEDFHKLSSSKDGRQPRCKICVAAYRKKRAGKSKSVDYPVTPNRPVPYAAQLAEGMMLDLTASIRSQLMPAVNSLVNQMQSTNTTKVIVDIASNTLRIVGPHDYKLRD